jgi:hypothetical protein
MIDQLRRGIVPVIGNASFKNMDGKLVPSQLDLESAAKRLKCDQVTCSTWI